MFVDRGAVSLEEELELFIADRDQHVKEVIAPALADGCVVICDRYYLSTIAYQGANGMDQTLIMKKNEAFPVPDLAIILEIEPAQGIYRIQNHRNEHPNSFEEEASLQKVAAIFASMQQDYTHRLLFLFLLLYHLSLAPQHLTFEKAMIRFPSGFSTF